MTRVLPDVMRVRSALQTGQELDLQARLGHRELERGDGRVANKVVKREKSKSMRWGRPRMPIGCASSASRLVCWSWRGKVDRPTAWDCPRDGGSRRVGWQAGAMSRKASV